MTCNGLQHLSAMGLDPVGALATNLRADGARHDVYSEVAQRVIALVDADAAAGIPEAALWVGHVDRRVCKRSVMTTPYGVTDGGIRRQLVTDGHVPSGAEDQVAASAYLGGKIVEALGDTIQSGKAIMGWLQAAATALAEAGLPFDWTTPTGSRVRQAYWSKNKRDVNTLVGDVTLREELVGSMLQPRKQALGSAPNYIHSFDAAHLSLTVNACWEEGVLAYSLVHDSYGTHAGETTRMARALREQFVRIYEVDQLAKTAEEITAYAPHVSLPALPVRGSFDIQEVLEAPFFFS